MKKKDNILQTDEWKEFKKNTSARIALDNAGGSIPLKEHLAFQVAHANAKDAIEASLEAEKLHRKLEKWPDIPVFRLKSCVENRKMYLKRPDLGKVLHEGSAHTLNKNDKPVDIVFVLTDGLSADAVNYQALSVMAKLVPELQIMYSIAIALVEYGRVAIGDDIGSLLKAKFTAVFIGERPGLSSPESMGIYTTYNPERGLTDERRNCISNIHQKGLSHENAAAILRYLVDQSFNRQISGVKLKIEPNKLL